MNDSPRNVALQSGLYTQIALYAAGNALSLAVFLMLYHTSAVLSDFRDPMLYALLCSIALRGPKDWLVQQVEARLSQQGNVTLSLLAACMPPYLAVRWLWREGRDAIAAFRAKVKDIQDEYQRNRVGLKSNIVQLREGGVGPGTPPTSNSGGAESGPQGGSKSSTAVPTRPMSLSIYAKAGLQTLHSRKDRARRRRRATSRVRAPSSASSRLLAWLFMLCLLWAGYEWIRDTWSRTAHVTLLTAAILAAAVTALWAVLNLLNIWQPLVSKLAGSPLKTPTAMGVSIGRTPRSSSGPSTSPGKAHIKQPMFDPGTPRQQGLEGASGSSTNAATRTASAILTAVDTAIRNVVHANVHAMVTLALIAALLLGTAGTATFISLQIANEARGAIAAARDAFPAAWPGVAGPVSLALEPLLPETGIEALGAGPRRLQQVASGVQLPPWLAAYQQDALAMAQRSLPGIVSWLEGQLHGVMKAHNLSDALWDARLMYESAQGPRACSERERSKLLVSLAKAEVALQQAREDEATARRKRDEAWRVLGNATAALDVAMASLSGGSKEAIPSDRRVKQQCSVEDEESCSAPDGARRGRLAELHQQVVAADADGAAAQTEHKAAVAGLDDALHAHKVANGRLQLCSNAAAAGGASRNATDSGLFGELSARLESAYTKLLWRWQFREGLSDLREVVVDAVKGLSRGSARGGAADLSRLHQLAQVAAVPLVTLGRTAASSVGATTAAAVMGSLGLFRLGLGVVHLGVQGALFLTLLYYLLAAKTDPLARAVALLPLPNAARHRAAAAINAALGGVFMSLLKLAALHGMFTWVTYRALRVPLAYTSATASAAFALLPFIPTYSVALPGCAMVALQGRVWTAAAVILLQFAAYYLGDTVVLEDAGGHPFMMSLAILGGLYSFPNPLLGCVLGPIMLSLLSALGTLHQELMGAAPVVATPGREGALRLGVEKAAPGLPVQGDTPRGRVNDSKPVETLQLGPRSVGEGAQEVPEPEDAEAEASLSLGGGHAALEARAEAVDEEEVDSFTFPRRKSGSMRRAT